MNGQNVREKSQREDLHGVAQDLKAKVDAYEAKEKAEKEAKEAMRLAEEKFQQIKKAEEEKQEKLNDLVNTIVQEKINQWRSEQKLTFPTTLRAGNLSRADKQLLDIIKGKKYEADLLATMGYKTPLSTTNAAEWNPTELAREIMREAEELSAITNALRVIPMPSDPFKVPLRTGPADVVVASEGQNIAENTTDFVSNVTLTAKKLAAHVPVTTEEGEDAIISVLPEIRSAIAEGISFAREEFHINGERDGSPISGVTGIFATSGVVSAQVGQVAAGGAAKAADFLAVRGQLGKWGIRSSDLVWIVGANVYNLIMGMPELVTLEKYGPNATIRTGEVGRFWGIPVFVSSAMKTSEQTYEDSETAYLEQALLINRRAAILGDRRRLTLKTDNDIVADLTRVVGTIRIAHAVPFPAGVAAM